MRIGSLSFPFPNLNSAPNSIPIPNPKPNPKSSMASQGGAVICLAEESLKAEKGTASEVGVATAMTMEEKLKILQDKNISLCKKVEEVDSILMDLFSKINWLDDATPNVERELEFLDSVLEKEKRKETSGVSEGEISKSKTTRGQHAMKRKTTRGQHAMKTPLPRSRLNQQETTACANKAVNRMSGGPKI